MGNLSQTSASMYEALERFRKKRTNLINQAHVEWSRELFDYLLQLLNKRMLLDVLLLTWQ